MKRLDLFLVIYVDAFKLAGPEKNLAEGLRLIRGDANNDGGKGLMMEDPTPLGQYLGWKHIQGSVTLPNGNTAKTIEYDMEDFLDSCVIRHIDLATEIRGTAPKLRIGDPIPRGHGRRFALRDRLCQFQDTWSFLPVV